MFKRFAISALCVVILAGCVAMPVVDSKRVGTPKSVAIVDIPDARPMAQIGVISTYAPGPNQFHFSDRADRYFDFPGAPGSAPFNATTAGIIPMMIESRAAETQQRAETFGDEVRKLFPGFDLRTEFMTALRRELVARGMSVQMLEDGRAKPLRLRWPARDAEGRPWPSGALESAPAVEADIVLQVSPVSMYNAFGPLNSYNPDITVGIALYNGRTREFLGRTTLRHQPRNAPSFATYDALLAGLRHAAPILRDGLVALAPRVADVASGRPAAP